MAKKRAKTEPLPWRLHNEDCVLGLSRRVKKGEPTLAIADPPYNLGQPYRDYVDSRPKQEYLKWTRQWVSEVYDILHPKGAFWFAINDENVAEVKLLCEDVGFYLNKWVIWYYTFGQNNGSNFGACKTHWLYFTKSRTKITFNKNDPAVRVPSARQLVYNDKRANSRGKLPDDFWILRPQDVPEAFKPLDDAWYFPRICGTFKAKLKVSPNQMPVRMLDRIIRLCSNPDELVIDPFNGTGSTGEACLLSGRRYVGFDVSKRCIEETEKRLQRATKKINAGQSQLLLFPEDAPPPPRCRGMIKT